MHSTQVVGVDGELVRDLTTDGRRAITHLIRTPQGKLIVWKRFHAGCNANVQREVAALRSLSLIDDYDVIPPLLDVGDDYFVIPYYADVLRKGGLLYRLGLRLMPLGVLRRVFAALRHFYGHGYELLAVCPHHALVDESGKVTCIDF